MTFFVLLFTQNEGKGFGRVLKIQNERKEVQDEIKGFYTLFSLDFCVCSFLEVTSQESCFDDPKKEEWFY